MTVEQRSWKEQRRDPRWQRKKSEFCQRENYTCEMCGDTDSEKSVHHSFYVFGRPIWDYPDESLHCLCWPCHQEAQATMENLNRQIGCLRLSTIKKLNSAIRAFLEVQS